MTQGPLALAQSRGKADGDLHVARGQVYSRRQSLSLSQGGSDGGGQRAARAVSMDGLLTLRPKDRRLVSVVEEVLNDVPATVTALDQGSLCAHLD